MHCDHGRQRGLRVARFPHRVWLVPFLVLMMLPLRLAGQIDGVGAQSATAFKTDSFQPGSARDLVQDGSWLRDSEGRYVLLRGVNFGSRSKLKPYLPVMPLEATTLDDERFAAEMKAVEPELERMRALGFNVVRLPVMWAALEPVPNANLESLEPAGVAYLEHVEKVIDALYAHGMFVFVDFHQDIASDVYGGDGFPAWAAVPGEHPFKERDLTRSNPGWGINYYDVPWWVRWFCRCGAERKGVRATLRQFWTKEDAGEEASPQTHFVKTLGQTVKFFATSHGGAGNPAILGYEPFNEPSQAGLEKDRFEKELLPKFYHRAEREIGKYDAKAQVFIEPRTDWNVYVEAEPDFQGAHFTLHPETSLPLPYTLASPNHGVFSFHYYDAGLVGGLPFSGSISKRAVIWPEEYGRMRAAAEASGLVPFLTEFGCSQSWKSQTGYLEEIYHRSVIRACMDMQFQQVEAHLLNETYWNYDLYNTERAQDNWNGENFSLLGPNRAGRYLDIVARPYPMRSSAKPERVFFDLGTKNAAFVLTGPVSDAPTVIYVPRLNYPGPEFEVRATTPAASVTWDEASGLLYWYPDKTAAENQIILSPAGGFKPQALPEVSRALLQRTSSLTVVRREAATDLPKP